MTDLRLVAIALVVLLAGFAAGGFARRRSRGTAAC